MHCRDHSAVKSTDFCSSGPRLHSQHPQDDLQLTETQVLGDIIILYSVLCAHCMHAGKYPWICNNNKGERWDEEECVVSKCDCFCRNKEGFSEVYFPQHGECLVLVILQTSV